jgi:hypothetical protein
MKTELVNGHVLPAQLIRMIATDHWEPLNRTADLSTLPIENKDDLVFLDVPEMIRNTQELRAALARGDGALFALVEEGPPAPGFLDVNQAVVIAVTSGQEALVLDYSGGEPPRAVATLYGPKAIRWVEVAQSFDNLLDILKVSVI